MSVGTATLLNARGDRARQRSGEARSQGAHEGNARETPTSRDVHVNTEHSRDSQDPLLLAPPEVQ